MSSVCSISPFLEFLKVSQLNLGGAGALRGSILEALGRQLECFDGPWAPFCELWGSPGCHGWLLWLSNSDLKANR